MSRTYFRALLIAALCITGCRSAYYGMWQKLGYEKRDILVSRVQAGRDDQEEAKKQFTSALQEFQALTNFNGGDLQAEYNKLNDAYESCQSRAQAVSDEINKIDRVAQDMFSEWNSELSEYQSEDLRRSSQQKLDETKQRYAQLIAAMRKSEATMPPVLRAFHDQVLYLKHNLNAEAISSLGTTATSINTDVQKLVAEMETSINEANDFISHMKSS